MLSLLAVCLIILGVIVLGLLVMNVGIVSILPKIGLCRIALLMAALRRLWSRIRIVASRICRRLGVRGQVGIELRSVLIVRRATGRWFGLSETGLKAGLAPALPARVLRILLWIGSGIARRLRMLVPIRIGRRVVALRRLRVARVISFRGARVGLLILIPRVSGVAVFVWIRRRLPLAGMLSGGGSCCRPRCLRRSRPIRTCHMLEPLVESSIAWSLESRV